MLSLCQTVRCQLSYGQANTPVFDAGQGGWNSRLLPSWPWPHSDACMRQSRVWPNCAQRLLSELPAPYCSRSNAPARGGGGQGGEGQTQERGVKDSGSKCSKESLPVAMARNYIAFETVFDNLRGQRNKCHGTRRVNNDDRSEI